LTSTRKGDLIKIMSRIARIVGTGYPHHIIERGNNREQVFKDSKDYEKYLSFLSKYSEEKKTAVLAYCLMPNHIHLLLKPSKEGMCPYFCYIGGDDHG
jgi:putative transposase